MYIYRRAKNLTRNSLRGPVRGVRDTRGAAEVTNHVPKIHSRFYSVQLVFPTKIWFS